MAAVRLLPNYGAYTPREAYEAFMGDREARNLSPNTMHMYRHFLVPFVAWLENAGLADISQLSVHHLRRYLQHLRQESLTRGKSILITGAASVRALVRWWAEEEMIDERVAHRYKAPRARPVLIQPFTRQQVVDLLEATAETDNPERNRAALLVLFDTGCRASELCGITDQDVVGDRIRILFGKGGKSRWVYISERTREAIEAWKRERSRLAGTEWLFTLDDGRPMNRSALNALFRRLKGLAGIQGVRCSAHTCRHTFASEWVRNGGPLPQLQRALGHALLATTARYITTNDADVQETHQKIGIVATTPIPPAPEVPEHIVIDGQEIRRARKARGWRQDALAAHVGLKNSHMADIERGELIPGRNVARRLYLWLHDGGRQDAMDAPGKLLKKQAR